MRLTIEASQNRVEASSNKFIAGLREVTSLEDSGRFKVVV
jgi:hypothetical protein